MQSKEPYEEILSLERPWRVVEVELDANGRSAAAVEEYLSGFSELASIKVQTVAMNVWQVYISAVEVHIPLAEERICFDKFHTAQHLGNAVDKVRREEHRRLTRLGDSTLKGSRYLWLKNPENLTAGRLREMETLRRVAQKTGRAWALKETAIDAWRYRSRHWARAALLKWYSRLSDLARNPCGGSPEWSKGTWRAWST